MDNEKREIRDGCEKQNFENGVTCQLWQFFFVYILFGKKERMKKIQGVFEVEAFLVYRVFQK
jgi:phage terminase large subunit-like protein